MDMEKFAYITIVILASFGLGFWIGNAYATSKYTRKQRKLTKRIQRLENFKHAVKVLCPKIRDGEDTLDYQPEKIQGIVVPMENIEDEDTKTGELKIERDTQGSPKDA